MIYLLKDGDIQNVKKVFEQMEQHITYNELIQNALVISPLQLEIFDGNYLAARDLLASVDWKGNKSVVLYYPGTLVQARLYEFQGDSEMANVYYDSARMEIEGQLLRYTEDPRLLGALGISYAGLGQKEKAIQLGKEAVEAYSMEKDAYFGLYRIEEMAWIYVMVEEYTKALEQLEILLSNPGPYSVPYLKVNPKWKPLWSNPSFIQFTEKYL
jgi:tetratricopeptide (TPR) repeat protein